MEEKKDDDQIIFLLKSMKKQYVEDTMHKGLFCFNHPTLFSQWEDANAAQYDRWEAQSAFEATYLVAAPIIGEKNGMPIYGQGKKIADKAAIAITTISVPLSSPVASLIYFHLLSVFTISCICVSVICSSTCPRCTLDFSVARIVRRIEITV